LKYKYIDLFAGIGGMRIGFSQACEELGHESECVFSSEWDSKCQDTYEINFGERPDGDITEIVKNHLDSIEKHDLLFAGFPCQPFSNAGLKKGFNDTRGTVFHDIAKIIKAKKPKAFILENVKGLRSNDKGNTLRVILKVLREDLGYFIPDPQILNAKDFGLPQNRQRIFIVGFAKKNNFTFPEPLNIKTKVSSILNPGRTPRKYYISQRLWDSHRARRLKNQSSKPKKGFGYKSVTANDSYTSTISARYYKDGAEILIKRIGEDADIPPRKLTPDEARQLQGFPDNFILNQSDIQAYKQFGNAVSVPVVRELSKRILTSI
jgi:DNA (cytosine-5)-methyltransferase 1